mmetsp:Transcript_33487/g.92530  ORF Transcript_33487/g.92530 Transcript_33487/m.92530 type:complete len:214 (-) Transcript_33487:231-872(-)
MGDTACRTARQLQGWLRKRKNCGSWTASRLLGDTNRRYFTLDFPGQILYYAHSESNKQTSMPIAFSHITKVEPLDAEGDGSAGSEFPGSSDDQMCSKGSRSSMLSLGHLSIGNRLGLPFTGQRRSNPRHGFVLYYRRPNLLPRKMHIVCSSAAEAATWLMALTEALCIASEATAAELGPLDEDLSTDEGESSLGCDGDLEFEFDEESSSLCIH